MQVHRNAPRQKHNWSNKLPLKKPNDASQPFMFHYRVFGCLGAVFGGRHYHNLLHFVHKLLHALAPSEWSCRPFTNCLQTVAPRKKMHFAAKCKFMSRPALAITYISEGAISGNVDRHCSTAAR